MNLLKPFQPVGYAASDGTCDGTFYRTAWAAFLHDLVEERWKQLLPTLQDGAVVRSTREQLRLTQTDLAR